MKFKFIDLFFEQFTILYVNDLHKQIKKRTVVLIRITNNRNSLPVKVMILVIVYKRQGWDLAKQ